MGPNAVFQSLFQEQMTQTHTGTEDDPVTL